MRLILNSSCSGFSATTIWMVEQFGLAMMLRFLKFRSASGFTSGTTSGTSGIHTEMAGVVDHDAAGRGRARGMDGGDGGAGAEQADVTAGEIERVQAADGQHLFLTEGDFRTRSNGPTRGR